MFPRQFFSSAIYPFQATIRLGLAHLLAQIGLVLFGWIGFYATRQLISNIMDPLSPLAALNWMTVLLAAFLVCSLTFPSLLFTYRRQPLSSEVSADDLSLSLVRFFPTALLTAFGLIVTALLVIIAGVGAKMFLEQLGLPGSFDTMKLTFGGATLVLSSACIALILPKLLLTPFVALLKDCQARAAYITSAAILERSLFRPFLPAIVIIFIYSLIPASGIWLGTIAIWLTCISTLRMVQFELEHVRLKHLELLKDSSRGVPENVTFVGGKAHIPQSRAKATARLSATERTATMRDA